MQMGSYCHNMTVTTRCFGFCKGKHASHYKGLSVHACQVICLVIVVVHSAVILSVPVRCVCVVYVAYGMCYLRHVDNYGPFRNFTYHHIQHLFCLECNVPILSWCNGISAFSTKRSFQRWRFGKWLVLFFVNFAAKYALKVHCFYADNTRSTDLSNFLIYCPLEVLRLSTIWYLVV